MRSICLILCALLTVSLALTLVAVETTDSAAHVQRHTQLAANIQLRGIPRGDKFRAQRVGYCDEDNDDGAICARRGCACGGVYDNFPCCTRCYIPPGNTYGECE